MRTRGRNVRNALLYLWVTLPCMVQATNVKFSELATTRLPYNQKITISGTVSGDFKALGDTMTVKSVAVSYSGCSASSSQIDAPPVPVSGDTWTVTAGPFEEGEMVCFVFKITGNLTNDAAQAAVDNIFSDPLYAEEVETFFRRASGQPADIADALARRFAERLTPVVAGSLPEVVHSELTTAVASSLIDAMINLRVRIQDMVDVVPGITATTGPSQAREALTPLPDNLEEDAKESAELFLKEYENIRKSALALNLQNKMEVSVQQIASGTVKYLEKYAAVDVGSLWIPRLDEFRAFAMLNIYWGPVELTPAPVTGRESGGPMNVTKTWLKERTSLMFGYSISNISSSHESKIRGNNVWVYGLGFRINRYFRLNAGGALYRGAPENGGLRNDFVWGPSLDLTAIEYFKVVFAKIK